MEHQHQWVEEYYGDRCKVCALFIPDGCGPWMPETEEEEDATVYRRCETCGGEFWDGGTSCSCLINEEKADAHVS